MDGETPKTSCCIFAANEDMETMRNFEQVTITLVWRIRIYVTFKNDDKHG